MTTSEKPSTQGLKRAGVLTDTCTQEHPQTDTEQRFSDHQQPLDLKGVTPEPLLIEHLHKLYGTNTLAPALLASQPVEHLETYRKLSQCADNITIKDDGSIHHHSRCNLRICPTCDHINARKRQGEMTKLLKSRERTFRLMSEDDDPTKAHKRRVYAAYIGLNVGERCHLYDTGAHATALIKAWGKLTQATKWKRMIAGFHRATEITLKAEGATMSAHPHIHATILIDASDPKVTLRSAVAHAKGALLKEWLKITAKVARKHKLDLIVDKNALELAPLNSQTEADLIGFVSYCCKGTVAPQANYMRKHHRDLTTAQHADTWLALYRQIERIRLFSMGGEFSETKRAHKRAEELRKLDRELRRDKDEIDVPRSLKPHRDRRPPEVTHRWSHPSSRWKPVDEYDHELDCSPEALLRGLYLEIDRDKLITTIDRMRDSQRRVIDEAQANRARDEESENRWKIAYWLGTGKAPPKPSKRGGKRKIS